MATQFSQIGQRDSLHERVTRVLAVRVIETERSGQLLSFPNEASICEQLGVSRSILREAVKVLADKGMLEVKPRSGTRARPRSHWNLLDPDILAWQARLQPDARFLRDLCEVRLAIEPTAAGFAALRAAVPEVAAIADCLERRERATTPDEAIDLDLDFQTSIIAASHNPLFRQLNAVVREPFRAALAYTVRLHASQALGLEADRRLLNAIQRRDPLGARSISEEIVGWAMIAVEQVIAREARA